MTEKKKTAKNQILYEFFLMTFKFAILAQRGKSATLNSPQIRSEIFWGDQAKKKSDDSF